MTARAGMDTGLGVQVFTIETWFKRTGAGVPINTSAAGGGGLTSSIPLVTKGRGEGDGSNVDMNYFLGIRTTDNVLVADFEDDHVRIIQPLCEPVGRDDHVRLNGGG